MHIVVVTTNLTTKKVDWKFGRQNWKSNAFWQRKVLSAANQETRRLRRMAPSANVQVCKCENGACGECASVQMWKCANDQFKNCQWGDLNLNAKTKLIICTFPHFHICTFAHFSLVFVENSKEYLIGEAAKYFSVYSAMGF